MRSGTTVCSTPASSLGSTPSIVIVERAGAEDLGAHAVEERRQVARSRAPGRRCRSTVVPLASTAAISAFSVAPTLGYSSTIRAPIELRRPRPSM